MKNIKILKINNSNFLILELEIFMKNICTIILDVLLKDKMMNLIHKKIKYVGYIFLLIFIIRTFYMLNVKKDFLFTFIY